LFFTERRALAQQAAVGEDDTANQESLPYSNHNVNQESDHSSLYCDDNNNNDNDNDNDDNDGLQTKSNDVGDESEMESVNVVISGLRARKNLSVTREFSTFIEHPQTPILKLGTRCKQPRRRKGLKNGANFNVLKSQSHILIHWPAPSQLPLGEVSNHQDGLPRPITHYLQPHRPLEEELNQSTSYP